MAAMGSAKLISIMHAIISAELAFFEEHTKVYAVQLVFIGVIITVACLDFFTSVPG